MNVKYSVSEVLALVRILLGEAPSPGSLPGGLLPEGLTLDELIKTRFEMEAANYVLERTPMESPLLPLTGTPVMIPQGNGRYVAHLDLPDDFARLAVLKMSDWKAEITGLTGPGEPGYARRGVERLELDGSPEVPCGYLVVARNTHMAELHGCRDPKSALLYASYVPFPSFDSSGEILLTPRMLQTVAQATAKEVINEY